MKKLAVTLTALLLALPLPACGGSGKTDPDALTIMGKTSDLGKPYMTNIFEHFKNETGKTLNIVAIEDKDYEKEAARRFRTGDAPDVFLHFHNADLANFDLEATFYMLDDEAWVSDLTDSAKAYCTNDKGNIIGLPYWESSVSGCYYNKTLLEKEIGLNAASTQAEFNGLCGAIAEIGLTPICWPGNGCSWMLQFGLDPVFADDSALLAKLNAGETTFADIPAVSDMIGWIAGAAEKGWFGKDYLEVGWNQIGGKLSSGEAVMTFIWDTWFYTDFKPGKYTVDDFALMPAFLNTAPEGTYEGGNLNMMMVNKNSEKLEEALEFLDFCATPANYNVAFEGISTVSCFKQMTTNIQSKMVTDAQASIARKERVSTAATKIYGYSADDFVAVLGDVFRRRSTVQECVARMDEIRVANAHSQGIPGF